ncbi:hypothetical protein AVEN_113755-1 [Araneus ventricosus]|uniref:Uncharacterized protein n=1 Tax=Araneus ventricosus TaxID=182803 RepID=A0A4Y2VEZ3_ARAVE|nr:hypothetical protein AVEN_113755-1 [Araneus ventricosus]
MSELKCNRPTFAMDLQQNRVSNLEPSSPELTTRPPRLYSLYQTFTVYLDRKYPPTCPTSLLSGKKVMMLTMRSGDNANGNHHHRSE